jgi:putative phosphoribosyl transferase
MNFWARRRGGTTFNGLHMTHSGNSSIRELSELRDRARVFVDRGAAGLTRASMLECYRGGSALVLAIPAGGVPVAVAIASSLGLALEVGPVSKVLSPWTSKAGYGAVAFDGTVSIDEGAVVRYGLTEDQVVRGVAEARKKVERRMVRLRAGRALPDFADRTVILVDDGIAAGSTMRTAIAAVRRQAPPELVVAVPHGTRARAFSHCRARGLRVLRQRPQRLHVRGGRCVRTVARRL